MVRFELLVTSLGVFKTRMYVLFPSAVSKDFVHVSLKPFAGSVNIDDNDNNRIIEKRIVK